MPQGYNMGTVMCQISRANCKSDYMYTFKHLSIHSRGSKARSELYGVTLILLLWVLLNTFSSFFLLTEESHVVFQTVLSNRKVSLHLFKEEMKGRCFSKAFKQRSGDSLTTTFTLAEFVHLVRLDRLFMYTHTAEVGKWFFLIIN